MVPNPKDLITALTRLTNSLLNADNVKQAIEKKKCKYVTIVARVKNEFELHQLKLGFETDYRIIHRHRKAFDTEKIVQVGHNMLVAQTGCLYPMMHLKDYIASMPKVDQNKLTVTDILRFMEEKLEDAKSLFKLH